MTDYIREIKRQLRNVYKFKPIKMVEDEPIFENIPDGEYPMMIEGRLDHVRIRDGKIECRNFES